MGSEGVGNKVNGIVNVMVETSFGVARAVEEVVSMCVNDFYAWSDMLEHCG